MFRFPQNFCHSFTDCHLSKTPLSDNEGEKDNIVASSSAIQQPPVKDITSKLAKTSIISPNSTKKTKVKNSKKTKKITNPRNNFEREEKKSTRTNHQLSTISKSNKKKELIKTRGKIKKKITDKPKKSDKQRETPKSMKKREAEKKNENSSTPKLPKKLHSSTKTLANFAHQFLPVHHSAGRQRLKNEERRGGKLES